LGPSSPAPASTPGGPYPIAYDDAFLQRVRVFHQGAEHLPGYRHWIDDTEALDAILATGAARAREIAERTMAEVRDRVGFLPPKG